jgi:hypothetical protein
VSDAIGFFIIATGIDEKDDPTKASSMFTPLADRRVRELVRVMRGNPTGNALLQAPARARFLHFDFLHGVINVYEHVIQAKGTLRLVKAPAWVAYNALNPTVGTGPQDPANFVDANLTTTTTEGDKLSITNVYHTVRQAPAQSVVCVDIFSHGWVQGPVLVNTYDTVPAPVNGLPMRTPTDCDGRVRTDFASNMGETPIAGAPAPGNPDAITQFFNGFSSTGSFRIYGCNVQDIVPNTVPPSGGSAQNCYLRSTVFEVLREAYLLQGLTLPAKPTLHMGNEFNLENHFATTDPHGDVLTPFPTNQLLSLHYGLYPGFFKTDTTPDIVRTKNDVIVFAAGALAQGYAFAAAAAFRQVALAAQGSGTADDKLKAPTVFGPVPSVGALFESKEVTDPLMRIDPGLRPYARFFEQYLSVSSTDSLPVRQRRYSALTPVTVAGLQKAASGGAGP